MDHRYRAPFLGVLDGLPRQARFIVLMLPIGPRTQPGARFAYAFVYVDHTPTWRGFEGAHVRCHRLSSFGVDVELFDWSAEKLELRVSAPNEKLARARTTSGEPDAWSDHAQSIIVHPTLADMVREAVKHYGFDPARRA